MPQSVGGASGSAEYGSATKFLTVSYQFTSEVTITLDFTIPVGGSQSGGVSAIAFFVAMVRLDA